MSAQPEKPELSPDVTALIAGNNVCAIDLYHALCAPDKNLVFAPYSISLALAMTYAGARGETAQQIAETARFTLPQDRLHTAFGALHTHLHTMPDTGPAPRMPVTGTLRSGAALWGQDSYSFQAAYLECLERDYQSRLFAVDFAAHPEQARASANQWISEQTNGRITSGFPPGAITPLTRLAAACTMYFKDSWVSAFLPKDTKDGPFTLLDKTQAHVPLMNKKSFYPYLAGSGFQVLAVPYAMQRHVFVIVLPDAGRFLEVERTLTAQHFTAITKEEDFPQIRLLLPRFSFEMPFALKDVLVNQGMPLAFTAHADFSGMAATDDLFLQHLGHHAFISVDEKGTEAGASIVQLFGLAGIKPPPPPEFHCTRPFFYAIVDWHTGTILFLGRVLNPAS